MIIFLNGKFVSDAKAAVSVFDHGFLYGDGVFERLRTYHGKIWNLEAHVKRLFHSAKLIKIHIPWSLRQIMRWTEMAVRRGHYPEANIRITLTRGLADKTMRYDFITPRKPTLCIMVSLFKPWPKEFFAKGVKMITVYKEREFPEIKTISLLPQVIANHRMRKAKADEAILLAHDGRVTEGTSCNVWFVRRGILMMPDARVLAGTTVEIVKKLARQAGLRVARKIIYKKNITSMQECFITSVTRGVMPVFSIDGKRFRSSGLGSSSGPGPVTKKLMALFQKYVARLS